MLNLSLNRINLFSPYNVINSGESSFVFVTDHGVKYEISFVLDYTLGINNSYQLCIDNVEDKTQPRDVKVRDNNHPQFEAISNMFVKFKEDLADKWNS